MRKRIWAVLLSVCLLVGLMPTTALAGGFELTTYQELVDKLSELQSGYAYLVPAENFGWPEEATLTIPANVGIQVESGNAWEIPKGITVNFVQNCQGIQCDELTINGTMNMAYSSQDTVLRKCKKIIIGPTGTFTCERGDYGFYIAPSQTCEVQSGATLNPRVRLDGTLTGEGTVSGMLEVSGGFGGTASNATLSGNLTLTGGLTVGRSFSDAYADRLTVPAGSHIKNNSWTTISHATVYLNGVMEWEKGEYSANSTIAAGGKIVMDGGKLIFNTPCELNQSVFEWGDGEVMEYEKVRENIPEPLIDGTGVIRFNDKVSATGEEYGWIMDCDADLVARTAQQVRTGTYDVENANALTWEPYCAIDLINIDIERSWACDHTWDDGVVTTEPTCTEPGEKLLTCTDEGCGETKIEVIPAGHIYEDGVCTICGAEEVQYDVSNIRFSDADADHPLLVWDCTADEGAACSVYITYDGGAEWELFESGIADAVCDIMEPGMDGVNGIKIELIDSNGTVKATATDVSIQISAEETTEPKDLSGTVSDAGDGKNFSWTISGFSGNTLVWVNFTDADGSIRSGLANVCTDADGSLSGKTPLRSY